MKAAMKSQAWFHAYTGMPQDSTGPTGNNTTLVDTAGHGLPGVLKEAFTPEGESTSDH